MNGQNGRDGAVGMSGERGRINLFICLFPYLNTLFILFSTLISIFTLCNAYSNAGGKKPKTVQWLPGK